MTPRNARHWRTRRWLGAAAVAGVAGVSLTYMASCYDFNYAPAGDEDGSLPDVAADQHVSDAGADVFDPCPSAHGPLQVLVQAPRDLGTFCIDSTEVTRGQYAEFVAEYPKATGFNQIAACTWNKDFNPDPAEYIEHPDSHPVTAIDWCDAYAFCQWAGKSLCGDVDGGAHTVYTEPAAEVTDRWRIACSHGEDGLHNYPYGNQYSPSACNTLDVGADSSAPVGTAPGCVGGFPGIFDMSGNVGEWENTCFRAPDGGPRSEDTCALRGGSYEHSDTLVRCTDGYANPRSQTFGDVGFRCCSSSK